MFTEINTSPLLYHNISVQGVEFSKCGRWLATCSHDGYCVLWDTGVSYVIIIIIIMYSECMSTQFVY